MDDRNFEVLSEADVNDFAGSLGHRSPASSDRDVPGRAEGEGAGKSVEDEEFVRQLMLHAVPAESIRCHGEVGGSLQRSCYEAILNLSTPETEYSRLLAHGSVERLVEMYEAAIRRLHGNMVFCLQLNGQCIGSSDFRESLFYATCRDEIEQALADRFGLALPEPLLDLEAELDLQYRYLSEFEEERRRHPSTPFTVSIENYLAHYPEREATLMGHLGSALWEQDSDDTDFVG